MSEFGSYQSYSSAGAGAGAGEGEAAMHSRSAPPSRPHSRARSIANAMFGRSTSTRDGSPASLARRAVSGAGHDAYTQTTNGAATGGGDYAVPVHGIDEKMAMAMPRPRLRMAPPPLAELELVTPVRPENRVLTKEVATEIRSLLPSRLQLHDRWQCVYSLDEHGVSLSTLYAKCDANRGALGARPGFVLVVRDADAVVRPSGVATPVGGLLPESNGGEDTSIGASYAPTPAASRVQHGVFGAFLNEHPRISASYYGNGECFLFKVLNLPPPSSIASSNGGTHSNGSSNGDGNGGMGGGIRFKAFPWTGLNDYQMYCTQDFLSLGGGDGTYALWLDDRLEHGLSAQTTTFGNEPLCESVEAGRPFDVVGVEVWRI